jgi:hypothetical protein
MRAVTYTTKQMGDACEMLVAAELTLAGVPALKVPELWPGYDIIAQPRDGRGPQQVSVKSRTYKAGPAYVEYVDTDSFDWLAIVVLPRGGQGGKRRIFVIPRAVADTKARRNSPTTPSANQRYYRIDEVAKLFADFEQNFALSESGAAST